MTTKSTSKLQNKINSIEIELVPTPPSLISSFLSERAYIINLIVGNESKDWFLVLVGLLLALFVEGCPSNEGRDHPVRLRIGLQYGYGNFYYLH